MVVEFRYVRDDGLRYDPGSEARGMLSLLGVLAGLGCLKRGYDVL